MQRFQSDDVEIAYIDKGEGYPTLLIHGFDISIPLSGTQDKANVIRLQD